MVYIITREELKEIGARIKLVQKAVGYSNKEMGDLLNISEIQYLKLLRGISQVSEDKFLILHKELGVSLDFLFTGCRQSGMLGLKEAGIMTDIDYCICSNEMALYIVGLPTDKRKEKMMEWMIWFQRLLMTL